MSRRWLVLISRTVPDFERITSDCEVGPAEENRTPCSKSPSVTPGGGEHAVVAGYQVVQPELAVNVDAGVEGALAFVIVSRPQPALGCRRPCISRRRLR